VIRFVELVRIKLIELRDANETPRRCLLPLRHNADQATAVLNSRWRPNVEVFTTAKAVRNLFAARARAATYELDKASSGMACSSSSSSRQLSHLHCDQGVGGRISKEQIADFSVEMALLEEGNSRLARITSLPVTRLLRCAAFTHSSRSACESIWKLINVMCDCLSTERAPTFEVNAEAGKQATQELTRR
jgi:hypothetical protein